ncbi:MAG TPA: hypothetical protein VEA69_23520 [Tepidisphaeraceae bacterium]|nr:hypothetical protein [Tepidisphaeraceae bacterium]
MSAPPALDYARPARRRLLRRAARLWPAWLLLLVGGLAVAYGPRAWRHYRLMRLQAACLSAELPQDRPAWEEDRAAAAALVAAWPAEYVLDADGAAMRADRRWAALAGELGVGPVSNYPPGWLLPTLFCHERHTPGGRRRLVVVEGWGWRAATVIEPGGWTGRRPRVAWRDLADSDAATAEALAAVLALQGPDRLGAGAPDPADRSRWTVPVVFRGVPGTLEYQLNDDDTVTVRLLDPAGFRAKAAAAAAR